MAYLSVITEKPTPHLDLSDWSSRINQLARTADVLRQDAYNFRQNGLKLRAFTNSDSIWTTSDNNTLLKDRVDELEHWRKMIKEMEDHINRQMRLVKVEKGLCDDEVIRLLQPIHMLTQFLSTRDCRVGSELTYDEADKEIKDELLLLESNQRALQDLSQRAWMKLNQLEEVQFKIGLEVRNKFEAVQSDNEMLAMDRDSPTITYKLNTTRIPRNAVSYAVWLEHTHGIMEMAKNELAETYALRESMTLCRAKNRIILIGKQERTDFSLRKRIFDTRRACNDLEYQIEKMQAELLLAECDMKDLAASYDDKEAAIKLVQSRLISRGERSGLELCLDVPHAALCAEKKKLLDSRHALAERIQLAQLKSSALQQHAERMLIDLTNKRQSLETDTRAKDLRTNLRINEIIAASKVTQTDRNVALLQMEDRKEDKSNQ